jgi:hypothetical protein
MGGPGGEPQGSPVLHWSVNPLGTAHLRLTAGVRFVITNWSITMNDTSQARALLNILVLALTNPDSTPNEEQVLAVLWAALASLGETA